MPDLAPFMRVELLTEDGDVTATDRFVWWESGMAELWGPVVLVLDSPVIAGAKPGGRIRITHGDNPTFDGVIVEPRLIDKHTAGLMMKEWEPLGPSDFDPTDTEDAA